MSAPNNACSQLGVRAALSGSSLDLELVPSKRHWEDQYLIRNGEFLCQNISPR
jgi:hypothetical protein